MQRLAPSFSNIDLIDALGLTYRISFQSYDNGDYSDREDISHAYLWKDTILLYLILKHQISTYIRYPILSEILTIIPSTMKIVDAGIGLTLIARF